MTPTGEGILLSGGSFANFAGLAAALRASTDVDINQRGVAALPGRPRIYTSAMTHMSMPKAASMLGIGKDAIVRIPVDRDVADGPDRAALRRSTPIARRDFIRCAWSPLPVTSIPAPSIRSMRSPTCAPIRDCGCTSTARTARWPRSRDTSNGAMAALGRADSLSLDPHKWLYAPLDAGCLLVRGSGCVAPRVLEGAGYIDVVADRDMSEFRVLGSQP